MASTVKISPMTPNVIATAGTEINPAVLPCELDAIHTIIREETIVAIVDFLIIPIYRGTRPNKMAETMITN
ncbi:hypothetical protein CJF15_05575 [Clostridium botulinum]|nr:hypothetical protein [Clostridium botulinum]MBN3408628.1 hypothetical protein [Clostridium botulinum]MBY6796340.1 hypothetical protein [Clostridium botulinum]MBY6864727.1 hypothetical protein [Clostridium botulinum]MBY6873591.1 hypothetical protein [Clostridium botulinum]MBY6887546.1 hypothetical protein [Clostridium botulinum]